MSALVWTFELSRATGKARRPYIGDYGMFSAVAATEDAARELVNTTCHQPYDDVTIITGDLLSVAAGDEVIWENFGRRGDPIQNGRQRSAAALAALRREGGRR